MNAKRRAVLRRIESLEADIVKAREYLENGQHAHWSKFRPLFVLKIKEGREALPHRDWVRNVFLPGLERALDRAERVLERLGQPP